VAEATAAIVVEIASDPLRDAVTDLLQFDFLDEAKS